MKLGVVFPQTEIGADPAAIRDFAQAAQDLGYDYLLAYDHVLGANPAQHPGQARWVYTERDMFHELFTLFGFLAGVAPRLELTAGILILPQRNTALVAKQAAQIDLLTGGRLRLGVAVGWNEAEMTALGYNFRNRGRRIDEQIALLNKLWTEPLVDFEGEFHTLHGVGINPPPVQRPIPLWFGGSADPVLRRAAKHGAGWIITGLTSERARPLRDQLRGLLADEGRDPAAFGIDVRISMGREPHVEAFEAWRAFGATHVGVNTMGAGLTSLDARIAALREFKAAVG